ncbi:hypothetical protein GXM_08810 [Nostoc sphaeroides CCNUC1]|uniref:Uncharacterized protein n=1 Tax=Nostoc sphaeroides CCNUC1 TaxID=2653204 RepID=A0A5P8WGM3_9NOSO|nr:hypothetical protein GXM_08810 [Nostoc sphaeroides CCNUC1]
MNEQDLAFQQEYSLGNTNELKHSTDRAGGRCINASSISNLW